MIGFPVRSQPGRHQATGWNEASIIRDDRRHVHNTAAARQPWTRPTPCGLLLCRRHTECAGYCVAGRLAFAEGRGIIAPGWLGVILGVAQRRQPS